MRFNGFLLLKIHPIQTGVVSTSRLIQNPHIGQNRFVTKMYLGEKKHPHPSPIEKQVQVLRVEIDGCL